MNLVVSPDFSLFLITTKIILSNSRKRNPEKKKKKKKKSLRPFTQASVSLFVRSQKQAVMGCSLQRTKTQTTCLPRALLSEMTERSIEANAYSYSHSSLQVFLR